MRKIKWLQHLKRQHIDVLCRLYPPSGWFCVIAADFHIDVLNVVRDQSSTRRWMWNKNRTAQCTGGAGRVNANPVMTFALTFMLIFTIQRGGSQRDTFSFLNLRFASCIYFSLLHEKRKSFNTILKHYIAVFSNMRRENIHKCQKDTQW